MEHLRSLANVLLLASLGTTLAAQGLYEDRSPLPRRTWTVNAAGGASFSDLPPAVKAARSGDVLLVAPGDYSSFELCGKGLTIVGDGGVPRVNGNTIVKQLATDEVACLRSLELKYSEVAVAVNGSALRLEDNAGTVWIEDSTIHRQLSVFNGLVEPALLATDCAAVVLVRSQVNGSIGSVLPLHPGLVAAALFASGSAVHAFESGFQGTNVLSPGFTGGSPRAGGDGLRLAASTLHASGCSFSGGRGSEASGVGPFCTVGGSGGAGLRASNASFAPVLLDCTAQGGPGGSGTASCPHSGPAGAAIVGTVHVEPLPVFRYELETPVRAGTSYQLSAAGQPGDFVWSAFAEELAPSYVPLYFGTQVGGLPVTLVFEGVADGAGALVKSVPVPALAALAGFERLYAQGLFFNATADAFLASPSVLVVVP